jgi:hypothetical protein
VVFWRNWHTTTTTTTHKFCVVHFEAGGGVWCRQTDLASIVDRTRYRQVGCCVVLGCCGPSMTVSLFVYFAETKEKRKISLSLFANRKKKRSYCIYFILKIKENFLHLAGNVSHCSRW